MTHVLLLLPLLAGQIEAPPAPPPSAKDAPTAEAPPAPAQPPARTVFLTVKSNRKDLLLIRKDNEKTVCTVPCDQRVAAGPDDVYYLGGSGISPSSRFDLTEIDRAARIDIRAGSHPAKILGIVFFSVSFSTILGGLGQLAWYGVQQIPEVQSGMQRAGLGGFFNPISTLVSSLITIALGAGLFGTGLGLWLGNRTRHWTEEIEPPSAPPAPETAAPASPAPAPEPKPAAP